ncbi:MAG: 50S ribosomal protein L22 [Akkermansiaceae bacterium]|nr:50S ribosomal protein L22 [Verrucomicrobiae bacterium]MCP5554138.1 50S ribosomal protein L22 [Akkermansiaceae bacterium]
MDVTSTFKHARISARKARDVTRAIQGLPLSAALDILRFTPRKAAQLIGKTVKAAMADAENNFELSVDTLIIKEATVGEGPTLKRFMPRARGSAAPIRKRTSHIRIVLTDDTAVLNKRTTRQDNARLGVKTGN